jgi:hypothetical protein
MNKLKIPITKSARQFGYIIWPPSLNERMNIFLGGAPQVHLIFMGADLGKKNVDWKYRRISIGYRWTHRLPDEVSAYILVLANKDERTLLVECQ